MAIKTQGTELNRTYTNFIDPADVGAFNSATVSIVVKGDAARRIRVTGFSFDWRLGIAADVGANGFSQVALVENRIVSADSNISIFPDANSAMRFHFGENAQFFQNKLREQFDEPFKLVDGVFYSFVGIITPSVAPTTATISAFLTLFGYEESEYIDVQSYYKKPR